MREGYGIGELARRASVTVPTIRYYEQIGVLPAAARGAGMQRSYDELDLKRLTFVKNCRSLGFPLKEIRTLASLSAANNRSCEEVRDVARRQLEVVQRRRAELEALQADLEMKIADCDAGCRYGPAPECAVLEGLSGERGCCVVPPLTLPVSSASLPRR